MGDDRGRWWRGMAIKLVFSFALLYFLLPSHKSCENMSDKALCPADSQKMDGTAAGAPDEKTHLRIHFSSGPFSFFIWCFCGRFMLKIEIHLKTHPDEFPEIHLEFIWLIGSFFFYFSIFFGIIGWRRLVSLRGTINRRRPSHR